jgi:prepilin-type N-terminal cleavage/methylation domain-containing protein
MIRKGFTLMEMIVMVAILAAVAVVCDSLFHSLLSDVPQAYKTFNSDVTADSIVDKIRKDMDRAVSLPSSFGSMKTDDHLLLIELPESVIGYRKDEKRLVRETLIIPPDQMQQLKDQWNIESLNLHWTIWNYGGTNHALEISTSVNQKAPHRIEKKLMKAHVFFAHILPEEKQKEWKHFRKKVSF